MRKDEAIRVIGTLLQNYNQPGSTGEGDYCVVGYLYEQMVMEQNSKLGKFKLIIYKKFGRLNPRNYHYIDDCDF